MKWVSPSKRLPKINEKVLCYYEIGNFQYYTVGYINTITTQQSHENEIFKSVEWLERIGDPIEPKLWARFPRVKKEST